DSVRVFLDSPDQSVMNIPASKVYYGDDSVFVEIKSLNGIYSGKFNNDKSELVGKWTQRGSSFPLKLDRTKKIVEAKRPQEPQRPFPYNEEEVTFENRNAGITLAGTFTFPKEGNNFPAVVLVTGSGPQNRNEEVFGHKPFLVWSDYLTRNGIAVLRFDDRGTGNSKGTYNGSTTADFVVDAIAAVEYLKNRKEIDKEKIGIVGHSEGGVIAPIAANKCKDISFIVLGAGTAVPGDEIISLQLESISRLENVPEAEIKKEKEINDKTFNFIKNSKDSAEAAGKINELYQNYYTSLPDSEKSKPENSSQSIEQKEKSFLSPWMRYFLKFDPRTELAKLDIPVLALFGEKDIQVSPAQNKDEMEIALQKSKSKNFKVIVIPGLNHVFQECETGAISEYGRIEQTTSPKMLSAMTGWIKNITHQ
ncbi:MAG: alpha/beta fold hydrolase, partial [Ignavibacteriaceae bacterium]